MNPSNRHHLTIGSFLCRAAEQDPQKTFLSFQGTQFSYAAFVEMTRRAARAFQQLKLGQGDKVCILAPNSPEFLFAWLGLAQIGAVTVFINTALKGREIQYIADHSESKAILTTSELLDIVPRAPSDLPHLCHAPILMDAAERPGTLSFRQMLDAAPADFQEPSLAGDDLATFIYTSGTTGLPKAVMQTHQTYVLTGEAMPQWLGLAPDDRLFACLPLFHINAQAYSVMGSLGAGASLILSPKFSASSFWKQIKESRATEFNLLGGMPLILLKQPVTEIERSHGARIAYTAPALGTQDHQEFERRFGINLVVGYGMSECTFGCIQPVDQSRRKLGGIGLPRAHPQYGNELRIADDDGCELGPMKTGEIALKNLAVMKGYFKDPAATAATLRDGWLFTGDLAYRDTDGHIFFAGRKKDMIRLKGENVSAYEVEVVIDEHPNVQESAVIGVPAELTDERIIAFVTKRPGTNGVTEGDIIEWCRERLAAFKVPSAVEFRDTLPRTPTQKVAKHLLRDEVLARLARSG